MKTMIDMPLEESIALLQNARLGRLAMVAPDQKPYTIPLRFLWHENAIYMRIAHDGRKDDALAFSKHVCFEADSFANDLSEYASVLVEGAVLDVAEPIEKEDALFRYYQKYARLCHHGVPARPVTINGVALRKLVIERISGRKREPDDPSVPIPSRLLGLSMRKAPRQRRAKA